MICDRCLSYDHFCHPRITDCLSGRPVTLFWISNAGGLLVMYLTKLLYRIEQRGREEIACLEAWLMVRRRDEAIEER